MSPQFVEAAGPPMGKRPAEIAGIIKQLVEADGDVITWDELTSNVGVTESARRASLLVSMHSLELVGCVDRFTYVEGGATRSKPAYALADGVEVTIDVE